MVRSTEIIQPDGTQRDHTISLILLKASSWMFEFRSKELLPWAWVLTLLSATGSFVVSNMVTVVSKFHLLRREREKQPTVSTCLVRVGGFGTFSYKGKERRKVKPLSRVWLFATPWTVAHQAPPSMGFSRQEYWGGLPFPSPGDFPDPGLEPKSPALQPDSLPSEPPGKPSYKGGGFISEPGSEINTLGKHWCAMGEGGTAGLKAGREGLGVKVAWEKVLKQDKWGRNAGELEASKDTREARVEWEGRQGQERERSAPDMWGRAGQDKDSGFYAAWNEWRNELMSHSLFYQV